MTYLIASIVFLLLWIVLFIFRKDFRKEMLIMSVLISIIGLLYESALWTKDWWHPTNITNTIVGIEDFFFGFASGGIVAVVYELLFRKHLDHRKSEKLNYKFLLYVFGTNLFITFYFFYIFKTHSFYATIIGLIISSAIIIYKRPDLIKVGLITALLYLIIAVFGFKIMDIMEFGFVQKWWYWEKLNGTILFGIPLEDFIWFLLSGFIGGMSYIYITSERLISNTYKKKVKIKSKSYQPNSR